ncbi:DNA repair protein RecN [Winogradskyella sp. A3E31]|uniref:DNA repair protein RecN n=1 Tax=Winogradskyella sp. A3E31 TaxID=3349637 RepID=UPI00398B2328
MLTSLSIKNYALIDELHVNFSEGLSIITGETGAGKSILLGALSLVLGKRADLSQIKDGSKKCIVEAIFKISDYNLKSLFEDEDLDYENLSIIRREILPSGKSRAFVNDTPVNLDTLQRLSSFLLDIHSQYQTRDLLNEDYQFELIDALAGHSHLLSDFSKHLKDYKAQQKKLTILKASKAESIKEYDYNLFLMNELEEAQLEGLDVETLEERYEQLNNVETIEEKLQLCFEIINNEEFGVLERLNEAKREITQISSFGKSYNTLKERLESVFIELDDIRSEIEDLSSGIDSNPKELAETSEKLQKVNSLLHKHNVSSISELLNLLDELKVKVTSTENLDNDISDAENELETLEKQLLEKGNAIRKNRQDAIPQFIKELESILAELGMPNARFKIDLERSKDFRSNGIDHLNFLFTANKGAEFQELKKAVSGGELSRIMLTIKSILAHYIKLPTLMFDEIDTGVSGEISNKMGEIMKSMSKKMQIFSITHLPQIAAKGDTHYKVFKFDTDSETQTQIKQLQNDERIVEIAEMLGGVNTTESAIAHAKQLLN